MNVQKSIARVQKSMKLDGEFRTAMMKCTAGRSDSDLIETFQKLEVEYQVLLKETKPDDQLLTEQMLQEKLADLKDWFARALENAGQHRNAINAYEEAATMFEAVEKPAEAQRSRDKGGELRLDQGVDFDEEILRLRDRLESVQAGSLERVQVLTSLGELHSKANDDFEAVKYLEQAEQELAELGGHPSDKDLLSDLTKTIGAINSGQKVAGGSAIETGIQRRALTQRILLAIGNAYRTTDPNRAAEYESRLNQLDDGKETDLRDLMGKFLDSGQDVTRFLKTISKKE